eukprot:6908593-Prymnesium_polylepis.1
MKKAFLRSSGNLVVKKSCHAHARAHRVSRLFVAAGRGERERAPQAATRLAHTHAHTWIAACAALAVDTSELAQPPPVFIASQYE